MRTRASSLNIAAAIAVQIILIFLNVFSRKILIVSLGGDYAGLGSLFSGILNMLSLTELGLGTALCPQLYQAFAKESEEEIGRLVTFFAKAYIAIAGIIFVLGLVIMPFLRYFIKDLSDITNINHFFFLYLLDTVFTYLFSAKRLVLQVDQRSYILSIIRIIQQIISFVLTAIALLVLHNYSLYLIFRILCHVLENYSINIYVSRKYSFLSIYRKNKLLFEEKNKLIQNVKAVIFVKIGDYFTTSVDTILISKLIGISATTLYSNCMIIITAVQGCISYIFQAVVASFGNLLFTNESDSYHIFNGIYFLNFWISSVCTVCLCYLLNPFIEIWLGKAYCLPDLSVLLLCMSFYLGTMRESINIPRQAAGLYIFDRHASILEAVINIVFSLILGAFIGLNGILIGTIITRLTVQFISVPYNVYTKVFKMPLVKYYSRYLLYLTKMLITFLVLGYVCSMISCKNPIFYFIYLCGVCGVGSNLCLLILTHRNKDRDIIIKKIYILLKHKMREM